AEELFAGRIDAVVFLTGVGAETLLEALKPRYEPSELFAALDRGRVVVRGPKPTAVLKRWGVRIDLKAPEPNTWRELAAAMRDAFDLAGKTVAVQEYGKPNEAFYDELRALGAAVLPVPVYRWALPEDTGPLEDAIRDAAHGVFDVVTFTSAQQIENVYEVTTRLGLRDHFDEALRKSVIVSIGPTCSERLREYGLEPDLEASPPKMGQMVRLAMERGRDVIAAKSKSKVRCADASRETDLPTRPHNGPYGDRA
ncbi:MAG TPA: uroporphyrinogen-III synthase, partial [Planctomycetaceae bacterium]